MDCSTEEKPKKKKKKLGRWFNLMICALAFIIMVIYLMYVDKPENIAAAFRSINPWSIVLCVLFMCGYWQCESMTVKSILKPLHPEVRFKHTWTNTIIGQYFNCITPFATGGQPMQAYYFVKFGVPLGAGLTALLSRFIVYQFVLTVYSTATLIIGFRHFGDDLAEKGLMPFVFIGFAVNTAVIIALLGVALWRKGTIKVVNGLITLLAKLRIVKKPLQKRIYFVREINKFHRNFKFLSKNIRVIIKSVIFTFVQFTLYLSITFLLYKGFGLEGETYLKLISYQAYVMMISSFIPSPGAMGGAELGFAGFFRDTFGDYTNVTMMLWRIFTFYLPIVVGMAHMLLLKKLGFAPPDEEELEKQTS